MAWIAPKLDYANNYIVTPTDMNRIEGNTNHIYTTGVVPTSTWSIGSIASFTNTSVAINPPFSTRLDLENSTEAMRLSLSTNEPSFKLLNGTATAQGGVSGWTLNYRPNYSAGVGTGSDKAVFHFDNTPTTGNGILNILPSGGTIALGTQTQIEANGLEALRLSASTTEPAFKLLNGVPTGQGGVSDWYLKYRPNYAAGVGTGSDKSVFYFDNTPTGGTGILNVMQEGGTINLGTTTNVNANLNPTTSPTSGTWTVADTGTAIPRGQYTYTITTAGSFVVHQNGVLTIQKSTVPSGGSTYSDGTNTVMTITSGTVITYWKF